MWLCQKIVRSDDDEKKISYAVVKDLLHDKYYHIHAKVFILAAGAILTPQILYNSEIQPKALGHYLCEQPMAFCQIVFKQEIIDGIRRNPKWKDAVQTYVDANPLDPIPIPMDDPTPQVLIIIWLLSGCRVHANRPPFL